MINHCTIIILNLILISYPAFSQSSDYIKTVDWLKAKDITINDPVPPPGFLKYRDCDSNVVYKKVNGDTITYYTYASGEAERFEYLTQIQNQPYFNTIVFPQKILTDGRVSIVHMAPKIYLYKKDTLFMLENGVAEAYDQMKMIEDMENFDKQNMDSLLMDFSGSIQRQAFQNQNIIDLRSYKRNYSFIEGSYPAFFKIIFYNSMFKDSNHIVLKRKPVIIKEKVITPEDKIELLNQWNKDGKKYFLLKMENAYASGFNRFSDLLFTSDGSFPDLENCQVNKKQSAPK